MTTHKHPNPIEKFSSADNRLMAVILAIFLLVAIGMGLVIWTYSTTFNAEVRRKLVHDRQKLANIYKQLREFQKGKTADGKLPASFDPLIQSGKLQPSDFISAANPDQSPPVPAATPGLSAGYRFGDYWFTYVGCDALVKEGKGDAAGMIIIAISAYSPPIQRARSILYATGTIVSVDADDLPKIIEKQNKSRAELNKKKDLNLPLLDAQAILGTPPATTAPTAQR